MAVPHTNAYSPYATNQADLEAAHRRDMQRLMLEESIAEKAAARRREEAASYGLFLTQPNPQAEASISPRFEGLAASKHAQPGTTPMMTNPAPRKRPTCAYCIKAGRRGLRQHSHEESKCYRKKSDEAAKRAEVKKAKQAKNEAEKADVEPEQAKVVETEMVQEQGDEKRALLMKWVGQALAANSDATLADCCQFVARRIDDEHVAYLVGKETELWDEMKGGVDAAALSFISELLEFRLRYKEDRK